MSDPFEFSLPENDLLQSGTLLSEQQDGGSPAESVARLRKSLARCKDPTGEMGAILHCELALALRDLAEYEQNEQTPALLNEARAALDSSLTFFTKERDLLHWAGMQYNLATILAAQAEQASPAENLELFREAIAAFQSALEVFLEKGSNPNAISAYNSLALAFCTQALRSRGSESSLYFRESAAAYRASLAIHSPWENPYEWARSQGNMAFVLRNLAVLCEGDEAKKYFDEAVAAYDEAFKIYTQDESAELWLRTKINLGITRNLQAECFLGEEEEQKKERDRLLREAIKAHRDALEERSLELASEDWANSQNNLAISLRELGLLHQGEAGIASLAESATALQSAIEGFSILQRTEEKVVAQINLAATFRELASRSQGDQSVQSLDKASRIYRDLLPTFSNDDHPADWIITQIKLAEVLCEQGKLVTESEASVSLFRRGVSAYRAALGAFVRAENPEDWASAQQSLAAALVEQAERSDGFEKKQLLDEAQKVRETITEASSLSDVLKKRGMTKADLAAQLCEQAMKKKS